MENRKPKLFLQLFFHENESEDVNELFLVKKGLDIVEGSQIFLKMDTAHAKRGLWSAKC